jgi:hypothetical protein
LDGRLPVAKPVDFALAFPVFRLDIAIVGAAPELDGAAGGVKMSRSKTIALALGAATTIAVAAGPAWAKRMDIYNSKHGCEQLVTATHPDLKGHDRGAEIKKCKADPDGYNKATGI